MLSATFFLLGLCWGSFLNVAIDWSVGKRKSFFTPPSYCDHCKHKLGFWDLIPVFSFVFLRGRCRYCGKKIFLHYPLVELATGVLFSLSFYSLFSIPYSLFLSSVLIVIFVADLRYGIIPDKVIFPAIALVLPYSLSPIPHSLFPAFLTALSFLALYLFTDGQGLGLGDVKLSFFLGLTLNWPYVILAMWIAFVVGGVVAAILLILGRKKLKDEIPLGPFLVIGTIVTMFLGKLMLGMVNKFWGTF